jgi:hypothetical protein
LFVVVKPDLAFDLGEPPDSAWRVAVCPGAEAAENQRRSAQHQRCPDCRCGAAGSMPVRPRAGSRPHCPHRSEPSRFSHGLLPQDPAARTATPSLLAILVQRGRQARCRPSRCVES